MCAICQDISRLVCSRNCQASTKYAHSLTCKTPSNFHCPTCKTVFEPDFFSQNRCFGCDAFVYCSKLCQTNKPNHSCVKPWQKPPNTPIGSNPSPFSQGRESQAPAQHPLIEISQTTIDTISEYYRQGSPRSLICSFCSTISKHPLLNCTIFFLGDYYCNQRCQSLHSSTHTLEYPHTQIDNNPENHIPQSQTNDVRDNVVKTP